MSFASIARVRPGLRTCSIIASVVLAGSVLGSAAMAQAPANQDPRLKQKAQPKGHAAPPKPQPARPQPARPHTVNPQTTKPQPGRTAPVNAQPRRTSPPPNFQAAPKPTHRPIAPTNVQPPRSTLPPQHATPKRPPVPHAPTVGGAAGPKPPVRANLPHTVPPTGKSAPVFVPTNRPPPTRKADPLNKTGPAIGIAKPGGNVRPVGGPKRIEDVRRGRVQSAGSSGQAIFKEPGNRTIVRQNNRAFITRNESTAFKSFAPGAKSNTRPNGNVETVLVRPGGVRIITETDRNGRLLRRFRRDPSGREITFVDNRRFFRKLAVGVGVGVIATAAIVALSRPAHALPRDKYIVDYLQASDDDIYETLTAPPVEVLDRHYSLEEVRYSESLRARMRRVDLDSITFEFGSFEVTPDQYAKLERIARAIGRAIEANPAEVFLIEGHTDAVGADIDNLSLSDRRAELVVRILVEHFNIPVENLVNQGYGEQFLKVDTQEPDRRNRRVAVRRITPLLSQQDQN